MRKSLFFALAVAGMLSSCSSEDAISTDANVNNGDLVPIQLGLTNSVITRGAGTVGGVTEEENVWKNQTVNVFMLNQNTLDEVKFTLKDINGNELPSEDLFYNTPMITPDGVNSAVASRVDGQLKYYPTQGNYDFWAYHVDEYGVGEPAVVSEPQKEGNYLYVDIKLDGSQDVMVAKAVPTATEVEKLGAGNETRYYSAFAARKEVQPSMEFKHLLSRLQFNVLGGNSDACAGSASAVNVKSIQVKSLHTGKLVVAYTGEEMEQLILKNSEAADTASFVLKQRAEGDMAFKQLVDLVPVQPTWDVEADTAVKTRVGEALLVAPAEKYEMTIVLSQNVQVNEDGTTEEKEYNYVTTIAPQKGAASFVKGSSYNVNITIFGLSEIKITTELKAWEQGEDVNLFPEDDNI